MRLAFDLFAIALERPLSDEFYVRHLRALHPSQSNLRGLCKFQRIRIKSVEDSALSRLDLRARQFSIAKIFDSVGVKAQMFIPIAADSGLHPLVINRLHFAAHACGGSSRR